MKQDQQWKPMETKMHNSYLYHSDELQKPLTYKADMAMQIGWDLNISANIFVMQKGLKR